jgi:ubiquinone/menaquinone biosynthesis C-methylase UbiE
VIDRTSFRSERLPVEYFDTRFAPDNVAFWVPRLAAALELAPGLELLDVGCGTGGFARALAERTGARVVGLDRASAFLAYARGPASDVAWLEGDAEALPFAEGSFDAVLLSLVLPQLADPARAVREAFLVLRPGGRAVVRTITPEDAVGRVPARFVPAMAAADAERMPSLAAVTGWLEGAGFTQVAAVRHLRNAHLDAAEEEQALRIEAARYDMVADSEIGAGLVRLREEAAAAGPEWVDPRPTYVISARRPSAVSASSGTPRS